MFERTGLCYVKNVPQQLPKGGRVLVHNCVHAEWQDQKPGVLTASIVGRRGPVAIREHGTVRLRMVRSAALSYSREGYENPQNVTGRIRPADHTNDVIR
jgi:hypothetical protein